MAAVNCRIGIIGGGFTGAVFAVHLAKASRVPLDITIVEPRERVGAGLAYGSCEPEHRINVPSDMMTVFAEDPLHFTRWLKQSGAWDTDPCGLTDKGEHYSARRDFGAYIGNLVAETADHNPSSSTIRHRRAAATTIDGTGQVWTIGLSDGGSETFDHLVLCATYATPPFRWKLEGDAGARACLVRNPWDWAAIKAIPNDASVVVIGTGLTMCDAVITLRAKGHRGEITAISRRGLTPREQGEFDRDYNLFEGAALPRTALGLLRLMRLRVRDAQSKGMSWRVVIDSLRRQLHLYWPTLPYAEQAKIARRLRLYWDVHRFRMAPQAHAFLLQAQEEGWLRIQSGRIHAITSTDGKLALDWTPKGGVRDVKAVDAIINCTGPDPDIERTDNPLLKTALGRGLVRPDALRIGMDVDQAGRVIGRSGKPAASLWAAGPSARAMVGEATGVPEASAHARHVAETLAAQLARTAAECSKEMA